MFSGHPKELWSMTAKNNCVNRKPGLWWLPWRVGLFFNWSYITLKKRLEGDHISPDTHHNFSVDPAVSPARSTSSPKEQKLLRHCLAAFQLWLRRGWRRGNFSHSVVCFPAKQCELWDELSRSDQLFQSNWRAFLIQYKALRTVQERGKTISTLIHNPGSYRLIRSVLVSYGPPEITWERRGAEMRNSRCLCSAGGRQLCPVLKKILLLWNHLGIEKLSYVQTGRNHPFTFFFFTSPVLRPTTTEDYWTHLLQVAWLMFKGTKVKGRGWVSWDLH